ncbi:MAG TPA: hypothetical protein PLH01_05720 [Kiritimatiellia bacterium]|nr:hypothetical protein [Kiritimatiellia bacterium]
MRQMFTRREALRVMGLGGAAILAGCRSPGGSRAVKGGAARWFRGNLHMHTYWSDGRAFPEQAIALYKQLGYDFISVSDHNVFAEDRNVWRSVEDKGKGWPPVVTRTLYDAYVKEFGSEVETRQENGKTWVRLKTHDEMVRRFGEPGRFLLMPAVEITQHLSDRGIQVHMNYVNLPDVIPSVKGGPLNRRVDAERTEVRNVIRTSTEQVAQLAAKEKRPYMLMLNHPQWIYWDIMPQHLIDNPAVRFFEVCNGGSAFAPHPDAPGLTNDSFWDAVNAFRARDGAPLLYGVGSDDTHYYLNRTPEQRLADAWVMVRSAALTPEALFGAMHAGDFYTSTGVTLEDVDFRPANRTLRVRVRPEPGVTYRIRFITTRKGFDPSVRTVEAPAVKGRGARTLPIYSADIGQTVSQVEGTTASYRMAPDDLYVRAKIESSVPSGYKRHFHPDVQVAWTQPYR